MSATEKDAIDAGTVWWDAELFSGRPNWNAAAAHPGAELTAEEQAFLDGPVEELCRMLDDWKINHELERPAARGLGLPRQAPLLRHDHPEGIRRARFLGARAVRGGDEDRQPQRARRP
jgi:hypothetical protein